MIFGFSGPLGIIRFATPSLAIFKNLNLFLIRKLEIRDNGLGPFTWVALTGVPRFLAQNDLIPWTKHWNR